jgi:aspartate dehydrogenase
MPIKKILKVGIVGCGTIGSYLAHRIERDFKSEAVVIALCDKDRAKAESLARRLKARPRVLELDKLIAVSDLVAEAAAAAAVSGLVRKTLRAGKDVIVVSVGGLLKSYRALFALARKTGRNIYVPSGAIGGLDALKSAAASGIHRIRLISSKPASALSGAPYLKKKKILSAKIKRRKRIFKGTAEEAIANFPQNINVCATLSLATLGAKAPTVEIYLDPKLHRNVHVIEAEGRFGKLFCRSENIPFANNPRTSYLAALSTAKTLENIFSPVKVGT